MGPHAADGAPRSVSLIHEDRANKEGSDAVRNVARAGNDLRCSAKKAAVACGSPTKRLRIGTLATSRHPGLRSCPVLGELWP